MAPIGALVGAAWGGCSRDFGSEGAPTSYACRLYVSRRRSKLGLGLLGRRGSRRGRVHVHARDRQELRRGHHRDRVGRIQWRLERRGVWRQLNPRARRPRAPKMGSVSCSADSKCCAGACVAPAPSVGCGRASCEACPEPSAEAGIAVCNAEGGCAIRCNEGYMESKRNLREGAARAAPARVVRSGAAGKTGGGGTTSTGGKSSGGAGGKPACDVKACTNSCITSPIRCCNSSATCGCTWAPGAYLHLRLRAQTPMAEVAVAL